MNNLKFILFIFLTLLSPLTFSKIVFINGAFNVFDNDSKGSMTILSNVLNKEGVIKYELSDENRIWVKGSLWDGNEVWYMQKISDAVIARTVSGGSLDYDMYYKNLGEVYSTAIYNYGSNTTIEKSVYSQVKNIYEKIRSISDNENLVIIAHSQGNLYAEAAIATLRFREGKSRLNRIRMLSIGSVAYSTLNNTYVNADIDNWVYKLGFLVQNNYFKPLPATNVTCVVPCANPLIDSEIENIKKYSTSFHYLGKFYLNYNLGGISGKPYPKLIAELTQKLINDFDKKKYILTASYALIEPNILYSSVPLQPQVGDRFTMKIAGAVFAGQESIRLGDSTCESPIFNSNLTEFSQRCMAVSAGEKVLEVYDSSTSEQYGIPDIYKSWNIIAPVLAPTAPTLADMGNGTVRVSWWAVDGATRYQVNSGQYQQATLGVETQLDIPNNVAGTTVCYRVRALSSASIASAYSAETCLTLDAKTCSGKWNSGYFNIGEYESTTQSCASGYTGNKTLSHICQDDPQSFTYGKWSDDTLQDNCVVSAITCQGAWTTTKYLVDQIETKTEACTGGQTGNAVTSHTCRTNTTWTPTTTTNTCACPTGKVLLNGICSTPLPTTCTGSWHTQSYAIGAVEDQYADSCPAGTTGQVRQFHTCQTGGIWSATANSDNCTAVLVSPTGLNISSVTGGIQITWTAVSGATKYLITRDGDTTYSSVSSTNYVDPNSGTGINRCYKIAAYSSFNNSTSPNSVEVCASHENNSISINPPSNVVASQYISNGRKAIRLTWNSASGADSYYIYRRDRAGIFAPVSGQDISFVDWPEFSLTSGISYCYFIRSIKNGVVSLESNEACAIAP